MRRLREVLTRDVVILILVPVMVFFSVLLPAWQVRIGQQRSDARTASAVAQLEADHRVIEAATEAVLQKLEADIQVTLRTIVCTLVIAVENRTPRKLHRCQAQSVRHTAGNQP